MKSPTSWILLVLALATGLAGGYWLGHRGAGSAGAKDKDDEAATTQPAEDKPVALVRVAPIRREKISDEMIAYGTVVAPPSEIRVVAVPFESRVRKILVAPGQTVAAGQPLAEVEGSAATALLVEEARNTLDAAQRDLQLVQQRYDQQLATNSDLYTAQNALKTAQGRMQSLRQGGAGDSGPLKAEVAGIVSKVDVQVGQVVPIGSPLVEVVAENQVEARLSAEPDDVPSLKPGQAVLLQPTEGATGEPVEGKIRLVGRRVDPVTRLTDVLVSLPPGARLMLESFVTGRITLTSAESLVVPRDAVLPAEGGGFNLFTVKDGKAVKHTVRLGIENDQDAQVIADDLKEGDLVVTVGNYELDDGMAVQLQPAAPEPAETQPADSQPAAPQPPATEPAASRPAERTEGPP